MKTLFTNLFLSEVIRLLEITPNKTRTIACQENYIKNFPRDSFNKIRFIVVCHSLKSASSLRSWLQLNEMQSNKIQIVDLEFGEKELKKLNTTIDVVIIEDATQYMQQFLSWYKLARVIENTITHLIYSEKAKVWVEKNFKNKKYAFFNSWKRCEISLIASLTHSREKEKFFCEDIERNENE